MKEPEGDVELYVGRFLRRRERVAVERWILWSVLSVLMAWERFSKHPDFSSYCRLAMHCTCSFGVCRYPKVDIDDRRSQLCVSGEAHPFLPKQRLSQFYRYPSLIAHAVGSKFMNSSLPFRLQFYYCRVYQRIFVLFLSRLGLKTCRPLNPVWLRPRLPPLWGRPFRWSLTPFFCLSSSGQLSSSTGRSGYGKKFSLYFYTFVQCSKFIFTNTVIHHFYLKHLSMYRSVHCTVG